MDKLIAYCGNLFALLGICLCLVAVAGRLTGSFVMFGTQSVTIFIGGIALIVMSCLFKLEQVIRIVRR
jgi:hypothetical protein